MFNKVLLKLSMVLIAVLALSASPASASCGADHEDEAMAPAQTLESQPSMEEHHDEAAPMPEHHE